MTTKRIVTVLFLILVALTLYVAIRSFRPSQPEPTPPTAPGDQAIETNQTAPAPGPATTESNPAPPTASNSNASVNEMTVINQPHEVLTNADGSPKSSAADDEPRVEPATLLENVRVTIRAYGRIFGGNPVGTNPEITTALNGGNPKQVRFIQPGSGITINRTGELVDSWNTPLFFHQLAANETEIRSAGPDRVLYTRDDIVTK